MAPLKKRKNEYEHKQERELDMIVTRCEEKKVSTRAHFLASDIVLEVSKALKIEGAHKRAEKTTKSCKVRHTYAYMRLSQGENLSDCEKCL